MSTVGLMKNTDYRLQIVIDGLSAICASPEDKEHINYNFVFSVDSVFDNEPLDWLPSLVNDGILSESVASEIIILYQQINEFTKNMNIEQEDQFIKNNSDPIPFWSSCALEILANMDQKPNPSLKRSA